MFTRVCKEDDIYEGGYIVAIADGQLVLLVWPEEGSPRAFQSICPHHTLTLTEAEFDGTVLVCPHHAWTFDGHTGNGIEPPNCRLAEYPLKIEDGGVYVDIEGVEPFVVGVD